MITNLKNIKPFIEKSIPFILTTILIVTTGAFGYHVWQIHEKHITGTLAHNIGATKAHDDGMAYIETLAQQYLDDPSHDTCPLYYAAKPKYDGGNPIPSVVAIDIESCDRSLSQHVIVFNTANGYTIEYSNGSFSPIER